MSNFTQTPQSPETRNLTKAESARINGALSTGPKTDAGKANSANARLKHGAYSKRVLMDGESHEGYEIFKLGFVDLFIPVDTFEAECVEAMVTARWRIRRLEAAETSNLNIALDANKEEMEAKFETVVPLQERAVAIQGQISFIEANTRVQERLYRIYERNFKLLAGYRKTAGRKMPHPLSGDPLIKVADTPPPPATPPVDSPSSSAETNLTDDPTPTTAPSQVTPHLVTKIAMFLAIFSSLLLSPVRSFSKDTEYIVPASAFYAPPAPSNSQSSIK
jgi:hypothetical protein